MRYYLVLLAICVSPVFGDTTQPNWWTDRVTGRTAAYLGNHFGPEAIEQCAAHGSELPRSTYHHQYFAEFPYNEQRWQAMVQKFVKELKEALAHKTPLPEEPFEKIVRRFENHTDTVFFKRYFTESPDAFLFDQVGGWGLRSSVAGYGYWWHKNDPSYRSRMIFPVPIEGGDGEVPTVCIKYPNAHSIHRSQ